MALRRWLRRSAPGPAPDVARARRTGAAVRRAGGWVWPHWLDRQLDPESPAFVPLGDLPFLTNVTRRNWTTVGNLDSGRGAAVDPRGLVTPSRQGWSLDWWIGADDRWHVPARDAGVRQHLVGASPVLETAARIPGGDAVQRVYAIRRSSAEGGGELVVVEVENRSKLPVALALAVRPYDPQGVAAVEQIDLHDTTVTLDGRPALLLPKPPARVAASTLAQGDSALVVLSGEADQSWPGPVSCPAGLAQAAFVYPLAHGASLRVALPLDAASPSETGHTARGDDAARSLSADQSDGDQSHRRLGRKAEGDAGPSDRSTGGAVPFPAVVPPAEHVAKGWEAQSRRGLRLDLPDPRLSEAVEANRRFLLLLHHRAGSPADPGDATATGLAPADAAQVIVALDHQGFHDEATQVLLSYAEGQLPDGRLPAPPPRPGLSPTSADLNPLRLRPGDGTATHEPPDDETSANGAVLWALARHWRLTHDRDLLKALVEPVTHAAHWIDRTHHRRSPTSHTTRSGPGGAPGRPGRRSGSPDRAQDERPTVAEARRSVDGDPVWSVAGLRAAAELLDAAGEPDASTDASGAADALGPAMDHALASLTGHRRTGTPASPTAPSVALAVEALVAGALRELAPVGDGRATELVDVVRQWVDRADGRAVTVGGGDAGWSPLATLRLASAELRVGDGRAVDRLAWLVDVATPTWTWPTALHPRLQGGTAGDGHDVAVGAAFLSLVRDLLVREDDTGLVLASVVPEAWIGQGWEVHDAPTDHGRLSYAVRWHGARPALLWELEPHEGEDRPQGVRLSAPGLDPAWSSTDQRGEALLAPVEPPAERTVAAGESLS